MSIDPTSRIPPPAPLIADLTFAEALRADGWLDRHHVGSNATVAQAAVAWLKARGI